MKHILKWGGEESSLFGKVSAYYGMVEAQGKGTLHLHLLIWLEGHLSPQELRDKMEVDETFKKNMFDWLESIIKCELPSTKEPISEKDGKPTPRPPRINPHPTTLPVPNVGEPNFRKKYESTVEGLVTELNWHVHNSTCWKYLKPGQPHDDEHCRMRIDGQVRPVTDLDSETGSILLRRLHPRISNHNDVLTFLLKCNNDIKFIGSGEAAKALVFYVTDYITKASLPTHVGLAAVAQAIRVFKKASSETGTASILTKAVNSMMGRLEISHQQVMSQLIGVIPATRSRYSTGGHLTGWFVGPIQTS